MATGCSQCRARVGGEPSIDIAFQPIFDIRSGRVCAYEALVRGGGGEDATQVLGALGEGERHGFEQRVRVMAIEKAVRLGLLATGASLSINMLPSAMAEPERCLAPTLATARDLGLATRRIVFEFSEKSRLEVARARAIVGAFRADGFRTALDDFGEGYAGLATLADVATDFVKLDIALVRGIDSSPERQAIVRGLAGIMAALGRGLVAEGVETAAELATVEALGVAMVQGFLLGRPSLAELQRRPYGMAAAA